MIKTKDIYWLAGLLEGEGSFCLRSQVSGRGAYPTIQLGMTDLDVVTKAKTILGGSGSIGVEGLGTNARRTKPLYKYVIAGPRAVGWMMTLYPLLGTRRQNRISEVLAAWHGTAARGKWKRRKGYRYGDEESRAA
jgi:hypothetical protein